ncbi:hypothetical protein LCGC14_1833050 [marine sediment metagenome]|uniref:Uncharacterized protein n=1 Tax=marine sediment metagenome TaxID=412755 RepID=A0A0F9GFF2_9ZZZZ
MKCKCSQKLSPWSITFGCDKCHYTLSNNSFGNLTKEELYQIKKECNYYLKENSEIQQLKDKLHRRNMQIKDLKKKVVRNGYIIRHLDENCEYQDYWSLDGDYTNDGVDLKDNR